MKYNFNLPSGLFRNILFSYLSFVLIGNISASQVYCIPPFSNCFVENIDAVAIAGTGFNNSGTGCANTNSMGYSVYAPSYYTTASLTKGGSYTISVTTSVSCIISVWIDFNHDNDFDFLEWKQISTASTAGVPASATMSIPTNALTGATRMRVRARYRGNYNGSGDYCTNFTNGETEDYLVTIYDYCDILYGGLQCNGLYNINDFSIVGTSLVNNGTGCSGLNNKAFKVYPPSGNTTTSLQKNTTYYFSAASPTSHAIAAWVDYDHSHTFDASEFTLISSGSSPGSASIAPFTIPASALSGPTAVRVRATSPSFQITAVDACKIFTTGETEEYTVTIVSSPNIEATFRVNMSNQIISPNGVHLAGSFNNWDANATPMLPIGGNVYEAIVSLDTTSTLQYKFINGNTFAGEETVPALCGITNGLGGYNRNLVVPQNNTILNTVCFSSCSNCSSPGNSAITFQVNMSNVSVSPNGVHLVGSFNNWDANATLMSPSGNNIYSVTLNLDSTSIVQYKFINGNSFGFDEEVPASCGVPNGVGGYNRSLAIPQTSTTLPLVCFSSCTNCIVSTNVNVTFRVDMSNESVSPNGIHLAGSFNNWNAASTAMNPIGLGIYEVTLPLDSTATIQYKFINGNAFGMDEQVPAVCGVSNGVGGYNRNLAVPEFGTTLNSVCFSNCSNCTTSNPKVNVTFRVNMSNQVISPNGIHLAGSFNNWDADSTAMALVTAGIYEVTLALDSTSTIQYKFLNGNTFSGEETVPQACGLSNGFGGYNRNYKVPEANATLPLVCFSSCNNCPTNSPLVNVTFRVNLGNLQASANGVHLTGSFVNWDADSIQMIPVGGNLYEATLSLDSTSSIQYKFLNGNTFSNEESVPSTCGISNGFGGYNRSLNVPQQNTVLFPVCFAACTACATPASYINVQFRVDLSGNSISPKGVHLAGTFNGFDADSTEMMPIGANVYAASISLDSTLVVQYKFLNGNAFGIGEDEIVPAQCGFPNGLGGYNRQLNVPESNTALPTVCFEACNPCNTVGIEATEEALHGLSIFPNPANVFVTIRYTQKSSVPITILIFNSSGKIIENHFIQNGTANYRLDINTQNYLPGLYSVLINDGKEQHSKKFIINR